MRERPRILVLDNYDSFVYNLVQYIGMLGGEPIVVRNDRISPEDAVAMEPDGLLISPGPGTPENRGDFGACGDILLALRGTPTLGICLGHQGIGTVFGGGVVRAQRTLHGKVSRITHDGEGVLASIPSPLTAGRYHSLVISREGLPSVLEVSAEDESGDIMGVRHVSLPVEGLQFHPESVLTENGILIIRNFLEACRC